MEATLSADEQVLRVANRDEVIVITQGFGSSQLMSDW
jgi:hypothetical protein